MFSSQRPGVFSTLSKKKNPIEEHVNHVTLAGVLLGTFFSVNPMLFYKNFSELLAKSAGGRSILGGRTNELICALRESFFENFGVSFRGKKGILKPLEDCLPEDLGFGQMAILLSLQGEVQEADFFWNLQRSCLTQEADPTDQRRVLETQLYLFLKLAGQLKRNDRASENQFEELLENGTFRNDSACELSSGAKKSPGFVGRSIAILICLADWLSESSSSDQLVACLQVSDILQTVPTQLAQLGAMVCEKDAAAFTSAIQAGRQHGRDEQAVVPWFWFLESQTWVIQMVAKQIQMLTSVSEREQGGFIQQPQAATPFFGAPPEFQQSSVQQQALTLLQLLQELGQQRSQRQRLTSDLDEERFGFQRPDSPAS